MANKTIIINTPDINRPGGVANFYLGLIGKFKSNVRYNYIGGKSKKSFFAVNMAMDYTKFIFLIIGKRPGLVHLNPSLDKKSLIRDAVFIMICRVFFRKYMLSWHGWQKKTENNITQKHIKLFRLFFGKAELMTVLSSDFKNALISWGIKCPIKIETTLYDDNLIADFVLNKKELNNNILFLSRVEEAKGIYVVLKAFNELLKRTDARLTIAGSGSETDKVKDYVLKNNIRGVAFAGYVKGDDKKELLKNSSIFILPSHSEGMPISMLEAMAFGLAVISRPVGGIKDFFQDGKMGYITESLEPKEYADLLFKLLSDKDKMGMISKYNYNYAKERFSASKVACRLDLIYKEILMCK